MTDNIDFPVL